MGQLSNAGIHQVAVATDFSPSSDAALSFAIGLARQLGAPLELIHVHAPPETPGVLRGPIVGDPDELQRKMGDAKRRMEGPLDKIRAAGVDFTTTNLEGEAVEELVRFLRENRCPLLVIGAPEHRPIAHALRASIAERLVEQAPCPVVVVPPAFSGAVA